MYVCTSAGPWSVFFPACLPCLSPITPFCPPDCLFSCLSVRFLSSCLACLPCLSPDPPFCQLVCLPSYLSVFLSIFCLSSSRFLSFFLHTMSFPTPPLRLSVCLTALRALLSVCLPDLFLSSFQPTALPVTTLPFCQFFDCLFSYLSNIYLFYVVQACIPSLPWLSTSSLFLQSGSLSGCLPDWPACLMLVWLLFVFLSSCLPTLAIPKPARGQAFIGTFWLSCSVLGSGLKGCGSCAASCPWARHFIYAEY